MSKIMKKYKFGNDLFNISKEIFEENHYSMIRESVVKGYLKRDISDIKRLFIPVIDESLSVKSLAILKAHGTGISGEYLYQDCHEFLKVQDWVNDFDGKFDALIIYSCNEGGAFIHSEKSKLIYPKQILP